MGVKNFDVLAFNKTKLIDPEQVGYEDSIEIINEEIHKTRKSFIKIGWYLKHIQDNKMYEQNGYANIYEGWSDKCLHAAYEYELYAEGDKASSLHQYMSEDLDETVQKMAETLNNGNTVVAKVNTQKGTRHFVLVIGIKKNAKAPYKESDFLCIDSYNHEVDKMGQPGEEAIKNGNYRTLYSQHGKYWLGSHVVDFQ